MAVAMHTMLMKHGGGLILATNNGTVDFKIAAHAFALDVGYMVIFDVHPAI
jgi:hypothetical protein